MYLDNERRPTLTPQLAFRVAIIGGIALAAFAVIFFRLWYLQVLSGDQYVAEAQNNRLREIKVQAPRGEIVDREGRVLVRNRVGYAVRITPDRLPEDRADRRVLYRRLATLLRMRPRVVERRVYPHREIGAHLFGHLGEASKDDLADPQFEGVEMGDRIGKAGIEQEYDSVLRGQNGATRVKVDALGNLKGRLETEKTVQGRQLRLALDLDVQRTGQAALAGGTGLGAFAVMDIHNGEVLGLGSNPSFDPNLFAEVVRESDYKALTAEDNGAPLTNRAVAGGYPTGSTFKLITAVAALQSGLITPDTVLHDPGSLTVGNQIFRNAGDVAHGSIALRAALTVSSDVFFYQLGRDMDSRGDGYALQRWARKLGLGRETGVDLPEEGPGFVPSKRWRNRQFRKFARCERRTNPTPLEISLGKCGWQDRPWSTGDNVNLSVGQGDLAANPLQMAVAYAAIANGGKVLRPRLGQRIENSAGQARQQLEAPTARRLKMSEDHRQAILDGLRGAASEPGGTSTPVFESFPVGIAGKTGTAEKGAGRADQSWYVALAPWPDPKYVVAVTDEAGGFGADTAAPMARLILAELFDVHEQQLVAGGGAPDRDAPPPFPCPTSATARRVCCGATPR